MTIQEKARSAYRRLYWLPKDLAWKRRLKGIDEVLYFGDRGLGDDLLCTAVLHEMHKRGRTKVAMMSDWPELFENLPYPAKVIPYDYGALHCIERAGVKVSRPSYAELVTQGPERFIFHRGKLIESMCRSVGIKEAIEPRPYFAPLNAELDQWHQTKGRLVVQTSRANPRFEFANKEWSPDYWRILATKLNYEGSIVQVGSFGDLPFPGAIDLRGKTSLRDLGAILAQARLFLGLEGFLMHLARAVDTRAVIIYGGWIHPDVSGYTTHHQLYTPLACAPCGYSNHCEFDRECMRKITPEMVAEAVIGAMGRKEFQARG
jgi:ADP-heptose:LPS heptosyltransferase